MLKKTLSLIFPVYILLTSALFSAGKKPTIAVLDLNLNDVREDAGRIFRNKIEFSLYKSGKFNILERNRLDILKKENSLSGKNTDSKEYAIEAGIILPAEYVITGSITFRERYYLHITLVDVKSGTIIYSFDEDYDSENMIYDESEKIVKGVEEKIYMVNPEEKGNLQPKTDFYLSVDAGYIPPVRKAEEFSTGGFSIDSEFGLRNLFIENFNAGVSAGYNHFYTKGAINYTSIIPLLITSSYTFDVSLLKISPGFGAGTSYITIDKLGGSKSAFEPCFSVFIKGDIMFTGNLGMEISSHYYTVYEPDGNIDFISFNAGIITFI